MSLNYPAGVSASHRYFNPPDEIECRNCGEEVMPGAICECGSEAPTEAELAEEYEDEAADRAYDMAKEDGLL